MTGRTHDLAALTALVGYISTQPLTAMKLGTVLTAIGANTIGGLLPDIDDASSDFWHRVPEGSLAGRLISPLLGHHRMISHSLLGITVTGWAAKQLLHWAHSWLVVDINIVWWALMMGYVSHLMMDSLTKEGVPWLFPIPIRFGFPPIRFLRITTGKFAETVLIFPGLLILDGYMIWSNYGKWSEFLTKYIIK